MTFPTTFALLPAGNQPASLLDTMFNIAGAAGIIPCTATGTNAISLVSNTSFYAPTSYLNFQAVAFVTAGASTGAVTIKLNGLAFVKLFMPTGIQATSGDLASGVLIVAVFNGALDSGNGGFMVLNATTPSVVTPVTGTFRNLKIVNGGTPDSQVALTFDEAIVGNGVGGAVNLGTRSFTISTGVTGANGLDTGSMANNTFYSVWAIFNSVGNTAAGLISLSSTTPALPAGYTYKARLGWVRTGAASTNLHRTLQYGRDAYYVITPASQTTVLPVILSGASSGGIVVVGANSFVPVTASEIDVTLTGVNTAGNVNGAVAPNPNYNFFSLSNPFGPLQYQIDTTAQAGVGMYGSSTRILLESTSIYCTQSGTGAANTQLVCRGWVDNL